MGNTTTQATATGNPAVEITFNPFFIVFGLSGNFQVINKERGVVHASFEDEAEAIKYATERNEDAHNGAAFRLQVIADGEEFYNTVASCDELSPLERILHSAPNENECSRIVGRDYAVRAAGHRQDCCHLH